MGVESKAILVEILVKLLSAEHFGNLDELVIIVASLEEGLPLEDHAGKHASERPNVQRVVVRLKVYEQLGSFEISRCNADIVLLSWMVEFSEAPIDETKLPVGVIDHDVVGLHVAMHDALRVAVIECLQNLKHVVSDIEIVEALVQFAEISVASINELSDDCRCLGQRVTHDINKLDNVHTVLQCLQNLDFTPDLVLFH